MSQDYTADEMMGAIDKAAKEFNLPELMRLTHLPADVIEGKRVMNRKERREWYRQNKDRLKLPAWGQLDTLLKKK